MTINVQHDHLVTCSVVSHGQGALITKLLADIRNWRGAQFEIIVTLNIPEDEAFLSEFSDLNIVVVRNKSPLGFGANHNQAHRLARGSYFLVANPDVYAGELDFGLLLETAGKPDVGVCAPVVISPAGDVEDSVRQFPTFYNLFCRVVLKKSDSIQVSPTEVTVVDWVGGMFMVFRTSVYQEIGGFDERYFMYFEDVDICRRMTAKKFKVVVDPRVRVVHDARRASRREFKHFKWHLRSLVRFLTGV